MGDWSDYFEEFPEENPANYDEYGNYDPNGELRRERKRMEIAFTKLHETVALKKFVKDVKGKV